jgi:hypothetical protein
MTVIELGDTATRTHPPAVPLDHRRLLRAVLALLAIAGLLTLAGSARPEAHGVRPLWMQPMTDNETFSIDEHTAYLNRMNDGHAELSAYDLATGALRWATSTGDRVSIRGAQPAGGIVLLPVDPVRITTSDPNGGFLFITEFSRSTIALDPATGRVLWRTAGEFRPDQVTGSGVLVSERDEHGRLTRLSLLRLPDGSPLWSRPVPGAADVAVTDVAVTDDAVITTTGKGKVQIYGYGDGAPRRTGQLPWPAGSVQAGQAAGLIAAGHYFTVVQYRDEANTATVYRPEDLRRLWSVDSTRGLVRGCAPLLCTFGPKGVAGLDPVTGQVRWQQPDMSGIAMITRDRLLLSGGGGNTLPGQEGMVLVDPTTGHRIGTPVRGTAVTTDRPEPSILVLRPTGRPGQVAVLRLDITTGTAAPVGITTSPGPQQCVSIGAYLVCRRVDRLAVMAVG